MISFVRRNIIEPLYSLMTATPKLRYWKELEKTQYLPEEILRARQWERLKSMLDYSYRNNRFYRKRFEEAGLRPSDIRTPDDMLRLPLLTKEEIRANMTDMLSDGFANESLLKFKTGGSTGKPLELYITEECSELRNACARRYDRWSGWEIGEPVGAVWGNPEFPTTLKSKLRNWLLSPTIYLDTMKINDASVMEFSKQWERAKPTLLFGHAHSIFILTSYLEKLNINSINPKAIISTSMMLLPHERRTIEEMFGIKVTDRYGCEEVSLIASECERHEGLHINIEHLFVEFLGPDGAPVRPGMLGRIVVTDLVNKAMPFIRYQVEDMGVPLDKRCSCGRGLPLMEGVAGRVADFLIKSDGTKVAGVSLIENTLTKIPGISQMQIVQESIQRIVLQVVPAYGFDAEEKEALVAYFKSLFGSEVRVECKILEEIKPERSGKYRFSICKVDPHTVEPLK